MVNTRLELEPARRKLRKLFWREDAGLPAKNERHCGDGRLLRLSSCSSLSVSVTSQTDEVVLSLNQAADGRDGPAGLELELERPWPALGDGCESWRSADHWDGTVDRCGFQRPDDRSVIDRDESFRAGAWEDSAYELVEGWRMVGCCTARPLLIAACASGGEGVRRTEEGNEGEPLDSVAGRPKVDVEG